MPTSSRSTTTASDSTPPRTPLGRPLRAHDHARAGQRRRRVGVGGECTRRRNDGDGTAPSLSRSLIHPRHGRRSPPAREGVSSSSMSPPLGTKATAPAAAIAPRSPRRCAPCRAMTRVAALARPMPTAADTPPPPGMFTSMITMSGRSFRAQSSTISMASLGHDDQSKVGLRLDQRDERHRGPVESRRRSPPRLHRRHRGRSSRRDHVRRHDTNMSRARWRTHVSSAGAGGWTIDGRCPPPPSTSTDAELVAASSSVSGGVHGTPRPAPPPVVQPRRRVFRDERWPRRSSRRCSSTCGDGPSDSMPSGAASPACWWCRPAAGPSTASVPSSPPGPRGA